jgi:hypothetical protein
MKPNLSKIRVIFFSRKTTLLKNYQYRLGNSPILRADCIKNLGVHIDSKFHFYQHIVFLFSHTMKLLELIRTMTFSFSTLVSILKVHIAIVRSNFLEYASNVWDSLTNTNSNKLERVQKNLQPFVILDFFKT